MHICTYHVETVTPGEFLAIVSCYKSVEGLGAGASCNVWKKWK